MTESRTPRQIATDAMRAAASSLLAECTEKQQAFFARLFPQGIGSLADEQLRHAITLCQRTISKNKAEATTEP